MTSESMDSMGRITLEFLVGTNMEEALLKVNSRLQQVSEYPEDADEPVISTSNASDRPIAWFILSALQPNRRRDPSLRGRASRRSREPLAPVLATDNPGLRLLRLRNAAKEHPESRTAAAARLERAGHATICRRHDRGPTGTRLRCLQRKRLGGLEEEMQVIVDPQRLAARQLTIDDVRRVLRNQNQDTSAGDFWEDKRRYVVRTLNQFRTPEQVGEQVLATENDAPVLLRDVADIQHRIQETRRRGAAIRRHVDRLQRDSRNRHQRAGHHGRPARRRRGIESGRASQTSNCS